MIIDVGLTVSKVLRIPWHIHQCLTRQEHYPKLTLSSRVLLKTYLDAASASVSHCRSRQVYGHNRPKKEKRPPSFLDEYVRMKRHNLSPCSPPCFDGSTTSLDGWHTYTLLQTDQHHQPQVPSLQHQHSPTFATTSPPQWREHGSSRVRPEGL